MWKIIKKSVEQVILNKKKLSLWMKWEFKIEFANDSFWPYKFKFERQDCYFVDALEDRWTSIFPLKWKAFDNTEIFLETNDIVIAIWERGSLMWWDKSFIDIINIKTEKKYRLFTTEINLIYNSKNDLVINAKDWDDFKTLILNIDTLEKKSETKEVLNAFFKVIYNQTDKKWFILDFSIWDKNEKDEEKKYQKWYFNLKKTDVFWKPKSFDRKMFVVQLQWGNMDLDVWKESNS